MFVFAPHATGDQSRVYARKGLQREECGLSKDCEHVIGEDHGRAFADVLLIFPKEIIAGVIEFRFVACAAFNVCDRIANPVLGAFGGLRAKGF